MAPPGVNAFYYHFFATVDPFFSLVFTYLYFFAPQAILDPAVPRTSPYATITPAHTYLLHQAGGAFATFAFLMVFLQRHSDDIGVWKLIQGSIILTDVATLYSLLKAIESFGEVRSEAATNVVLVLIIMGIRGLFVAGVGVGETKGKKTV
ncbi:hypothetical protein IQ07DRAFT_316148 [Pyrenochaeta sp. DS3sAY3a]|nr:hypothetical protein IQ07DRAFT_316148 [Pyrenochaeta sp. DS3sAY3a]